MARGAMRLVKADGANETGNQLIWIKPRIFPGLRRAYSAKSPLNPATYAIIII